MSVINEATVKYGILTLLWVEFIWEFYLAYRQYKVTKSATQVPPELKNVMNKETYDKARLYSLAKAKYGFVKDIFSILMTTAVIYYNVLAVFWVYSSSYNPLASKSEVLTSCIWCFILSTASTIIDLPFVIYQTFVLEEEFGFNKQTAHFFVWDRFKSFLVYQVLTLAVSALIINIIKSGGDYFFIWLWLSVCILVIVMIIIYPSVIAPLFDKYTPLPEGELRSSIEALASELNFPLTKLYVVEGSKRSTHSNAYFYGLFKSKRIVLFDTLLATPDSGGCQNDEVLAVLAHELGHWKFNHTIKNLIIMQVNMLLLFSVFAYLFKSPVLYRAMGFYSDMPVLVGLLIVMQYVMMPYNTVLSILMTRLSRSFEFQADRFAMELDREEPLKRALIQLNKDNLGFPIYDAWYSAWHHSHPPLLERIKALNKDAKKSD